MAITTYSNLQTAVANWLARDDLTTRIPEFIRLSEAKFNRDLRCTQMEKRSTTTVDLSSDEPEYITLPTNFQTMRRVRLSSAEGKPRLQFLSGVQMDEYRYTSADTSGRPVYFTILGDELELGPTPDIAYTVEMVYRANIRALSDVAPTNWLLDLAPDIYLYAALMEAAPYMKDDMRLALWSAGYTSARDALNKLAMEQSFGAGPLEVRSSGRPTP